MNQKLLRAVLIFFIVALNVGCDQSTKILARKHLEKSGTVKIIDNFLILHYTENRGAFLSLFSSLEGPLRQVLLLLLPALALCAMAWHALRNSRLPLSYLFAVGCIVGGGVSNVMIDRMFRDGYVVDFMNVGIGSVRSGIFNFADLSIMLGLGLLVYSSFRMARTEAAA